MQAAVVVTSGEPPVHATFAEPQPGAGEVLVAMTAAALSPLTRGRAAGRHYSSAGGTPFVAGVDGTGRLPDGRRVYLVLPRAPFGTMAERVAVPAAHCVPVPDDVDDATAAVLANPGMSSWAALTERARLAVGETVLVNGATGAAGRLAVRIARHLGAGRVIATGRNRGTLDTLDADATVVLDGSAEEVSARLAPHAAGGIDVVLDYLWGASAHSLLVTAARRQPAGRPLRFVQIGAASGGEITVPAAALRSSAITLMGSGLGSVPIDRLLAAIGGVLGAARAIGPTPPFRRVPLADVAKAWSAPDEGARIVFACDGGASAGR